MGSTLSLVHLCDRYTSETQSIANNSGLIFVILKIKITFPRHKDRTAWYQDRNAHDRKKKLSKLRKTEATLGA